MTRLRQLILLLLSAVSVSCAADVLGPFAATAISTFVGCIGILAGRISRQRDAADASTATTDHAGAEDAAEGQWLQRILAFAAELRGSLSSEQLYGLIAGKLPALAGVEHIWIETLVDQQRRIIAPTPSGELGTANPLMAAPGEWATFPLQAGQDTVGVLGIGIAQRPLSSSSRRTLTVLVPLIAQTLHTAQTIQKLRELSTVDSVTGCATRQEGLDRLHAELKRAHRSSQEVAVLMLDLDHFKSINDRYGHQCGDAVLAAIGRTIMQTLRVSDIRCRWGGEEFLVALPDSGLEPAKRAALALARRIAGTVTEYDSARIQLTTSIGITVTGAGEDDPEPVIVRADAALYRAKADGRNCIRIMMPDGAGAAPAAAVPQSVTLPFRDRRDAGKHDRRHPPGPGRRATDALRASRTSPPHPTGVDGPSGFSTSA